MNRRNVAAAAAATVALTVLTGCMSDPDTAGVAKSEPVLVDDATDGADDGEAWCEKAVAKAVENLDDAKDAPKASTFEGHRLTSPDAETRVCTWRAVVGADGNVALVEDWKASFAADADGKWKLVDAALVTDDEQHVAGQGPEFAAVDALSLIHI